MGLSLWNIYPHSNEIFELTLFAVDDGGDDDGDWDGDGVVFLLLLF